MEVEEGGEEEGGAGGEGGEAVGFQVEGEVEALEVLHRPGPLDQQPTATGLRLVGLAGRQGAPAPPPERLADEACLTSRKSWNMSRP